MSAPSSFFSLVSGALETRLFDGQEPRRQHVLTPSVSASLPAASWIDFPPVTRNPDFFRFYEVTNVDPPSCNRGNYESP